MTTRLKRSIHPAFYAPLFGLWLGFALRVYQLAAQSLWYDEAVSWYLTRMSLPQLTQWTAADIQPPLYYYLLWLWVRLAGTSEYALRFPSVVCGLLTLPLLWLVARRLFSARAGGLVLLLGIVSPLHVYYAQEARMYTLLTLLGLLSSYLLLRLLDPQPPLRRRSRFQRDESRAAFDVSRYKRDLQPPADARRSRFQRDESRAAFDVSRYKRDLQPPAGARRSRFQRNEMLLAVAYVLSAAAALYTHYFAFFLLTAHAVYAGYRLWCHRHDEDLTSAARAACETTAPPSLPGAGPTSGRAPLGLVWRSLLIPLAVVILYLPWLPYLLNRYGLDTSYWPGALQMDEVARKLLITFGLGETVTEQIGLWLAVGYGVILALGLLALALHASVKHQLANSKADVHPGEIVTRYWAAGISIDALVFLLCYFLVPIVFVLALAYRTPKFNPRYAMLAWPAFVLLLAGGLSAWPAPPEVDPRLPKAAVPPTRWVARLRWLAFALGLGFVLATSAYALANWYAPYRDNQFNKADFRITAGIVGERVGPNETVLLSSGHMFPAWTYYYGWQGWHALPEIEVLDVNATLDLSVGRRLDDLLAGKHGVWLVRWQNETTDPFDVLPLLLSTAGAQDDYGQFWHMELRHYALPPGARFDVDSFVTRPVAATFGGQVRLIGVRAVRPAPSHTGGEDGADIVLVWQAIAPPTADYAVFTHLLDNAGSILATGDHLPARPTHEWPVNRIIPDRAQIAVPAAVPDGTYELEIGLYDAGQPGLPRLGAVIMDASGELQPGERVLVPVTVRGGRIE